MTARLYLAGVMLTTAAELDLPPDAVRHVQVLRLQPGAQVRLFNGDGGEWDAEVLRMGARSVAVRVQAHYNVAREPTCEITLAIGMPANDRMDGWVEKAVELGATRLCPLLCARSILRLEGERAQRRQAHWQAVAVAAAEQSGRTVVPVVAPIIDIQAWLSAAQPAARAHWVLSLTDDARPIGALLAQGVPSQLAILSGPEGGLTETEEAAARARGCVPVSLGPRVLRADTAPLAALARIALS